jgi:hypothetical protein
VTNEQSASTLFSARPARLGLIGLLLAATFAGAGNAEGPVPSVSPFQVAIAPGIQLFSQDVPIWGLDLNLFYGSQQTVFGLTVGFMNKVSEDLSGFGVGGINVANENATGIQVGAANGVNGRFRGLQLAILNINEGTLEGAQFGATNATEDGSGFQLGVYNHATSLKGLQVGLINVNKNGFLPVFPIFNFGY